MRPSFGHDPRLWPNGARRFVAYLHFMGWENIQLGFHINVVLPNIEIHLPFCFVRVGWARMTIHPELRADAALMAKLERATRLMQMARVKGRS